jgi:hypothetical protein
MSYGLLSRSGHPGLEIYRFPIVLAASTAEQDSGYDLPDDGIVLDVFLNVKTPEATGATKTLDVGLKSGESGGDTDGFLDGVSVAAAGMKKGTLASAGQTKGALLRVDESGSGDLVPEAHILNGTAKSVVYAFGSNDFAELDAEIVVLVARPNAWE